jgi:hypothetical protein
LAQQVQALLRDGAGDEYTWFGHKISLKNKFPSNAPRRFFRRVGEGAEYPLAITIFLPRNPPNYGQCLTIKPGKIGCRGVSKESLVVSYGLVDTPNPSITRFIVIHHEH